jgi:hypothetical protein
MDNDPYQVENALGFDIRTARKHRPGADYNDRGLPRTAVIFLPTEELCVASLPLLRKKRMTIRKPLISRRRQVTQVLTRGADQVLHGHGISSLKAHEMDGLIRPPAADRWTGTTSQDFILVGGFNPTEVIM